MSPFVLPGAGLRRGGLRGAILDATPTEAMVFLFGRLSHFEISAPDVVRGL
jgi:hypothetical protein